YVGLTNFGGYTRDARLDAEPAAWHLVFGRRAFFGYVLDPAGGAVWFANVPRPEITPAERAATGTEAWRGPPRRPFPPCRRSGRGAGTPRRARARRRHHLRPAARADLAPRAHDRDRRRGARAVAVVGPGRVDGDGGRARARAVPARRGPGPGRVRRLRAA